VQLAEQLAIGGARPNGREMLGVNPGDELGLAALERLARESERALVDRAGGQPPLEIRRPARDTGDGAPDPFPSSVTIS
jgi:hypothetical protein